mgnify:CR=1 FL=1
MARRTDGGVRFRPVGSSRHPRTPVRYSPGGTGCPAIEQAIEQLYHGQNEESFWALMGALNYALELETHVLVPLQTALGTPPTPAPWAENPVPQQKARGLALWTLKNKDRTWLPLFTSMFALKYRRMEVYGKIKEDIGIILRKLCQQVDTVGRNKKAIKAYIEPVGGGQNIRPN